MNIFDRSKRDFARFTQNKKSGAGVEIEITFPSGPVLNILGPATKHHMSVDDMGIVINAKQAYCSFSESQIIAAGETIRNSTDEIDLGGFIFKFKDSRAILKSYKADQWFPNESIDSIVVTLTQYDV